MATVYATEAELAEYVGTRYPLPADSAELLADAAELIDGVTLWHGETEWVDPLPDPPTQQQTSLRRAVLAQVEYWLELGPEAAVAPPAGDVAIGQLRIPRPPELAPKARRALLASGLLYRGVELV